MKAFSFERKVVLTLLVAVLAPLLVSAYLVWNLVDESLTVGLNPRIRGQLEASLDVYKELFRTQKQLFGALGTRIAADPALGSAIEAGNLARAAQIFGELARPHPEILRSELVEGQKRTDLWKSGREADAGARLFPGEYDTAAGPGTKLSVTFQAPETPFAQMKGAQETLEVYRHVSDVKLRIAKLMAVAYLIVFGGVTVVVLFLGITHTRRFLRPLRELAGATERVRKGDLSFRIEPRSGDEVGELTESFNRMIRELRENRGRIIYLEKISSWQEIARRLAHEIKNPLTPINLAMQELHAKYRGNDEAYRKLLDQSREIIDEEIDSLKRMVDAFSSFAKLPAISPETTELDPFIEDFLSAHNHFKGEAEVSFAGGAAGAQIRVDRVMFRRVLDNLVRNAIEAAGASRAAIAISTTRGDGYVALSVNDSGPGIPQDLLDKVFNPYFTTKKDGTGLGLPIARKIVLDHGGELSVENVLAGGARFVIILPSLI
jgi:nitrogen fixation/metabolism regulation signal transduction histidine kinase